MKRLVHHRRHHVELRHPRQSVPRRLLLSLGTMCPTPHPFSLQTQKAARVRNSPHELRAVDLDRDGGKISALVDRLRMTRMQRTHSLVVLKIESELLIVLLYNSSGSLLDGSGTHTTLHTR